MNKLSFAIGALLLLVSSTEAFAGGIGTRNLDEERKAVRQCFVGLEAIVAGTDTTTGTDGLIIAIELDGATPTDPAATDYAMMPFPAKVGVDIDDDAEASAVTCTVVIQGVNQFGRHVAESVSASETAVTTTHVYSRVTKADVTGCTNQAVNDHLILYTSQEVGLGVKVRDASDVEQLCIADSSDSNKVKCASADNGTANDVASAIELSSSTIDLSTALFGDVLGTEVAIAEGDMVCMTVRPSFF